ncbi:MULTISPECIES: CvpA family protein [unclassified Oceanobacter]|uniref:CvpA family protein n=1 Tax=unclassified Oceanobacter TaxID=2620260 RepID=UPI0026E3F6F6|nr:MULTISPECIES: CvpA family protein [unclassified Oceanobacter]MDO6681881.1 CvpA family protein [Oceanobacter sp. 5_MG-2023]MDP2607932.1 CvpA family protein [Oceanobacter sp. 1_MG-2023]MDP2611406.1 CvpA family protein [Oceanobacter sp. 2_MG-2023]
MIFDVVILLALLTLIVLGYRYGTSKEMLDLAKVFLPISIASAYSDHFGLYLTQIGILRANDWAVLTLTGFLVLFLAMWFVIRLVERVAIRYDIHGRWIKENRFTSFTNRIFCAIANGLQALLLLTFFSFLSTQVSFVPKHYKSYLMANSISYPAIDRICRHMVNGQFVDALINDPTGTTKIELILKTVTDKTMLTDISEEIQRSTIVRARDALNKTLQEFERKPDASPTVIEETIMTSTEPSNGLH